MRALEYDEQYKKGTIIYLCERIPPSRRGALESLSMALDPNRPNEPEKGPILRRLNPQDDRWLAIETPESPYQIGALLLFELDAPHGAEEFVERVRAHLVRRLPSTPLPVRFVPAPFHFDTGMWCHRGPLDLDLYFFPIRFDQIGDTKALQAFVAQKMMEPWAPDRAPFRIFAFERIQSDQGPDHAAIMLQTHHALADGIGFQSIVTAVTDAEPSQTLSAAGSNSPESAMAERPPGALPWLLSSSWRFVREAAQRRRAEATRQAALEELAQFKKRPENRRARTPTLEGLPKKCSMQRLYRTASLPLEEFKRIGKALGGSVNDAFLTVAGGALRAYLDDRGLLQSLADQPLVGLGARSVRQPENGLYGNHITLTLPQIATHVADPRERFALVKQSMRSELERSDIMQKVADSDPRPFGARQRRSTPEVGTQAGNLSVSNVPGPQESRFLGGYRMTANYPAPNLPEGQLVNITLRRYVDMLDFGFSSCPTIVPDLDVLKDQFIRAHQELLEDVSSPLD